MRTQPFNVTRGTTQKCLAHLSRQIDTSKRNGVEPIARSIGISTETASRWLRGKQPPKGLPLVKLRYYLRSLGYIVTELEQLNSDARALGALLAQNAMSVREVTAALGYRDKDAVLRILHGEHLPIGDRKEALHRLVQQHATEASSIEQMPAAQSNGSVPLDRAAIIKAAALLAKALWPLAAILVGDQFTAADREALRQAVPGDGIFHLSRDINQLCGERARMQFAGAEWRKTEKEGV